LWFVNAVTLWDKGDGASAEHCCRFIEPGRALLGEGSGFVFGVAGLEGRLLSQLQRLDRGRRPAMIFSDLNRDFTAADVDAAAAGLLRSTLRPGSWPNTEGPVSRRHDRDGCFSADPA